MISISDQTRLLLAKVSTAALTTQLLKRGFRKQFMSGVRALSDKGRVVGEAFTLRYIPAREDVTTVDTLDDSEHPQRKAIE